jgi:hypothetical protein
VTDTSPEGIHGSDNSWRVGRARAVVGSKMRMQNT